MDNDLKCNRLTCRKPLSDKAVVTTCSHIFCGTPNVTWKNDGFDRKAQWNAQMNSLQKPVYALHAKHLLPSRLLLTSLQRLQDIRSLRIDPNNDPGDMFARHVFLAIPVISREVVPSIGRSPISSLKASSSFQQAVVRKLTDQNNQSQKQLDGVVREANNEIALLTSKVAELQRDLEMERRKVRDLQEGSRDRDREYQKLKTQHDKIKRKALLGGLAGTGGGDELHRSSSFDESRQRAAFAGGGNMLQGAGLHNRGEPMDLGAVVGGMEASGIQRTPLVNRVGNNQWPPQGQHRRPPQQIQQRHSAPQGYRSGNASDSSHGSAREVETMLGGGGGGSGRQQQPQHRSSGGSGGGWVPQPARMPPQGQGQRGNQAQSVYGPPMN